jgi:3-hydroxyisobutyrate dehydrogenase-like beta-hydroxyacid dehydrogenase
VSEAELVCLCVFTDDQARAAMLGEGGALAAMPAGSVLAVHTSGSPTLARELGAAAPAGVRVIDAPFSGQQEHLKDGALTLLVGGDPAAFEAARPVFSAYARQIAHVGGLGAAQQVKLVNQFLYRANLAAADAALRVLEAQGLERSVVVPPMLGCSGASWALGALAQGPSMAERTAGFQPYLDLYLAAAAEDGLAIDALLRRGEPDKEAGDGA